MNKMEEVHALITEEQVLEMSERLAKAKIKVKLREEDAEKATEEVMSMLASIDDDTLQLLISICPKASCLQDITMDDVINNTSNVKDMIYQVLSALYAHLDQALTDIEGWI